MGSGIDVRWNGKGVAARGVAVYWMLSVLAIMGSNLYAGLRVEQALKARAEEHRLLRLGQDRTSCILSMNPEDRVAFRRRYHTGAFKQECPWIEE